VTGRETAPNPKEIKMAKRMNSIEAFIGGKVETPEMGYGHTEAVLKGYTSGSQLFDERAMDFRYDQRRTNNEGRVNGQMVRGSGVIAGWAF
jgi:chorismate synthase